MTGVDNIDFGGYELGQANIVRQLVPTVSKETVIQLADELYNSRGSDPAEGLIKLKVIENAVKLAADLIKSNFVVNKTTLHSAELTCVRDRKYDFSEDARWREIDGKIDNLKKLQKERENFLRALVAPVEEFSKETGESLGITLPAKLVKDAEIIKITIK